MSFVQDHDFVDLYSDVRWTYDQVQARCEAIVSSQWPDRRRWILLDKTMGLVLTVLGLAPVPYIPTPAEQAELQAYAQLKMNCGELATYMEEKIRLLNDALDYEAIREKRNALPDDEEHAAERAALQAQLDDFPENVEDLVELRDIARSA